MKTQASNKIVELLKQPGVYVTTEVCRSGAIRNPDGMIIRKLANPAIMNLIERNALVFYPGECSVSKRPRFRLSKIWLKTNC